MERVAPPWQLTGNGLMLLYHFPRSFVEPWLAPELRAAYRGGIGAVICVDYVTSNVGPYRELLFIPGSFGRQQRDYSISQIFVSTLMSMVSGQANWAIPKQLAAFAISPSFQHFSAFDRGIPFFRLDVRAVGPYIPLRTAWSPVQPALIQHRAEETWLRTRPFGRAAMQLARVRNVVSDGVHFPAIGRFQPLVALFAHGFSLTFPTPETISPVRHDFPL